MEINYNNNWTTICNSALTRIGRPIIAALSEDSQDANLCREFLPEASAVCAEYADWSFLMHSLTLPSASNEDDRFSYRYSLPMDIAILAEVDTGGYPFEKRDGCIYTDCIYCRIQYTSLPEIPSNLPKAYTTALSCYLAFLIAYPLTGNNELRNMLLQEFQTWIEVARTRDKAYLPKGGNEYWCKG